jgi:two-component system chemotaxis sensor kinase CheA
MTNDPLAIRLLAIFAEELEEQLVQMRRDLAALQQDPADREHLRGIFRVMHTLKGAARAAGVSPIEQVCHALESDLVRARDAGTPLDVGQLALLLDTVDAFAGAREQLSAGQPVDSRVLAGVLQRARRGGGASPRVPRQDTPSQGPVPAAPTAPADVTVSATAAAPEDEPVLGAVEPVPADDRAPRDDHVRIAVRHVDAIGAAAGEVSLLASALSDRASDVGELRAKLRDELHRDAGVGAGADARQLDRELARMQRRVGDDARALAALSGRLDDALRHLRQRPVRELTETVARVARDVAREVGKEVRVTSVDADIEADRVVMEALREPLLHLARNAVDHGIESPSARLAVGKPAEGGITIEASLRGDRLRLSLADDGGGLDLDAIRRTLERNGMEVPPTPSGVAHAIFDDGFSTRRQATTFSGRGVGLSIVRASVERLGGTAEVHSVAGQGTTFVLDVPLSIATMRALLVVVGESILAIPSAFVLRVLRVVTAGVKQVDGHDMLTGDGAAIHILPLAALIGAPYRSEPWGDRVQVVVLQSGSQRVAVTVDDLLDERELVLRPLEHVNAETASATVGSAIIGTGDVVLVLSAPSIIAEAARRAGTRAATEGAASKRPVVAPARILVVDDSITSRTLEQSVLAAAGYDVTTAVDGAEAWRLIERSAFALVVSDVEMPRLDGIGLCERIRATPRTATLPVILVTSLDEPEHRARGLEAGADAYVAKSSFDQDALLDTVRLLLGRVEGTAR